MRFRKADGEFSDTTLDRVSVDDVVAGLPGRVFRSFKGRQHYSGWYWAAVRLVVYESRLELARIMLADFDPAVAGLAEHPNPRRTRTGVRRPGRGPFPGAAQVSGQWPGKAELGMGGDDDPGPPVGGLLGVDWTLLQQAEDTGTVPAIRRATEDLPQLHGQTGRGRPVRPLDPTALFERQLARPASDADRYRRMRPTARRRRDIRPLLRRAGVEVELPLPGLT